MKHVFDRNLVLALTMGPLVSLWVHVNCVKRMLLDDASPAEFEQQKPYWETHSLQTWNPFTEPGSPAALAHQPVRWLNFLQSSTTVRD